MDYCKKLKVDRAIDLFQRMPLEGLTPTIETYNTILQGSFHTGRHVEARIFFKEKMMLNKGLTLDKVTCYILLHGLSLNSYAVEALSFFHTMEHSLRPDVKTHTMMIQAFCHEGLFDEAKELFVNMESNNCLPNDVTYNTLICGCLHNKKYNESSVLIDEMCAHSFPADASTTSLLLDLLELEEQDPDLLALLEFFVAVASTFLLKLDQEILHLDKELGLEIKLIIGILERNVQLKALRLSAEDSSMQNSLDPIQGKTMTLRSCTWRSIDISGMATVGQ
ncbi:hypothetical protein POM88_001860 [Heracleum sosnowskyi]|uniref:Pentatricopeptide repeat-containing protein n=1 Tax=Heracleum sosnowskyi TaxID=360622 RepID=A0AAD8N5F0_9APIA|nr:hypothetical protein POM88_001860 [Heracleum sosnowskyi]